ncbi:hypothetical protein CCH79_00006917 [Gambusia affinis]|uniref:carnosine N-methyltransferase n=1 Tax=Gambusia affinis TaxID=33528 RepID=A0A315V8U3_GAMAF|nr:hypothetical protein CCH79_00006917 [Gambusia affinis]
MAEQRAADPHSGAHYQKERRKYSAEEEAKLERQHFWRIIDAFRSYRFHVHEQVKRAERQFRSLSQRHQRVLPGVLSNLARIRQCAEHNQEILDAVVHNSLHMFENVEYGEREDPRKARPSTTFDMDKLKSTIKQFVSVLIPGAGLGRLAWEIARLGYSCQGNEWSFFMLFSSNFVLNRCEEENALTLYPWIHQFSNNKKSSDQTRPIRFPDVNPQSLPLNTDFSMVAGDFVEVYSELECWDCVSTCFFIDTANNVLEYVDTIWKILKPGGVWINLGPLLYHFENIANELSIELSYEDIRTAMIKYGFIFEVEKESMQTTYTENECSMLRYVYDCVFFVARKPTLHFNGQEEEDLLQNSPPAAKSSRREGSNRQTLLMAKRRAEETVLLGSPSKRRYFPPIYSVDMQLEGMASVGGVSSPALLTLLGSRCRKRPLYFDNDEGYSCPAISPSDSGKHAKDVLKTPSSRSFPDGRRSCALSRNKRPREESVGSDTVNATHKTADEDDTYNSFQYWRVPLPELDLSLLDESSDHYPKKDKNRVTIVGVELFTVSKASPSLPLLLLLLLL